MTIIIGIDGLGGSGKSTYAQELKGQIESSILFHLDDFIHPKEIRYNNDYEEWYCYYQLQWRYDYLIHKLLNPLKNGLDVCESIEIYDKKTDSYIIREIRIPAGTTVIIEGVFLQRPELERYFNLVIYIDVNEEKRLDRVLNRDTYIGNREEIVHKYEHRYFPAEAEYVKQCNPLMRADVIERDMEERPL